MYSNVLTGVCKSYQRKFYKVGTKEIITHHLLLVITILFSLSATKTIAQTKAFADTGKLIFEQADEFKNDPNIIKTNSSSAGLKNFSIQYERVTSRRTSLALSFKWMPGASLPIKNLVIKTGGQNDPKLIRTIENLRLKHFAFSPEIRFYLGKKGFGKGFYVTPFYRYAGFKTGNLLIAYEDAGHRENNIAFAGKLVTHTGGIMIGAQWNAGKHLVLDWWIAGPQYSCGKGALTGLADKQLSIAEQQSLQTELTNLDFPKVKKTIEVNSKGASLLLSGPWAGVRGGLSLGIRY